MNSYNAILELVRSKLKESNLSCNELAQMCKLQPSTLSRIINGEHKPNVLTLLIILDNLNIKLDVYETKS